MDRSQGGVEQRTGAPAAGAETISLMTSDGVRLHALHAAAGPGAAGDLAIVFGHGFTGSTRKPAVRRVISALRGHGAVVAVDFRGHGRSGGLSTLGGTEILDIEAAVRWARAAGYLRVATVGASMGGSIVVRHAALYGGIDAVVCVSAPSRWYVRDTVPMRRVHWLVEQRLGRLVSRALLRIRLARRWDEVPESPMEVVGRIAPTPLLIVHGDHDAYFTAEHPAALADAAGEPAELWMIEGFGHAEAAMSVELADRIGRWVATNAAAGASGTIAP
ncbi:MAG: alpha/beta fold hydrolase [Mycobacteriales bacterium]